MSLLGLAGRRYLGRHPWQTALAVTGIALGVAVFVGVDLANGSVRRAFDASSEIVSGRSTHQVIGAGETLDETLITRLATHTAVGAVAPVVEGTLRPARDPDRAITLLGLDPFLEAPFRGYLAAGGGAATDLTALLTQPDTVVLTAALARRLGTEAGSDLEVLADAGPNRILRVAAVIAIQGAGGSGSELIVADITTAQELLGLEGVLTRIDVIVDDHRAAAVAAQLPSDVELVTAGTRNSAVLGMTRAFRINLTALSLLALLVGVFLIYSTMSFMVVRRRAVHGMLRAVGVTGRQIFRTTLVEALMIGVPGTIAGLLLGQILGAGLITLVTRTVDDLYFRVVAAPGALDPGAWLAGALLGLGGTLVAAMYPARDAARASPRRLLSRAAAERRTIANLPALAGGAIALGVASASVLYFGERSLVLSFIGLFLFIGAGALMTPLAVLAFGATVQRLTAGLGGVTWRIALRGVGASLSRTGVAVAALTVAVATVIGIGVMIGSFRASVADWLSETVKADIYVAAAGARRAGLDDALVDEIEALSGIAGTRVIREVRLPDAAGYVRLWAIRLEPPGDGLALTAGEPDGAWRAFDQQDAVLVSEPFANRRKLAPGDTLTLRTNSGPLDFAVAGVFRDYTSDQGVVAMNLQAYRRHWDDTALTGIGVFLAPGADLATVRKSIEARAGRRIRTTDGKAILELSLAVFDRTFTITEVLRMLAGTVAFLGVFSALQALQLERSREIAVLRATGLTPRQVFQVMISQTGVLGLAAGLFAIPIGVGLAWLLVNVINARAFGWTMGFSVPVAALVQGVALAVVAALLAGIPPALRSARAMPVEHLRDE